MVGKLLLEPSASVIRFWRAAAGLKNICENFDHGTDPKSTVVAVRYKPNNNIVHELPVACIQAQIRPNVTLASRDRMNTTITSRKIRLLRTST